MFLRFFVHAAPRRPPESDSGAILEPFGSNIGPLHASFRLSSSGIGPPDASFSYTLLPGDLRRAILDDGKRASARL